MHVLHVVPNFCLRETQIAVLEYCRVARMRGVQVSVLALSDEGELARRLLEAQLVSCQVASDITCETLEMQLHQMQVDVVHTHTGTDFTRILPRVAGSRFRLVHTFHITEATDIGSLPPGTAYQRRAKWVCGTAAPGAVEGCGVDDVTTILDGVWSPPFESLDPDGQRDDLGVAPDEFVIGTGALQGVDPVVEQMTQVRERLLELGVTSKVVVFGATDDAPAPEGFIFVGRRKPVYFERLEGLDAFVQTQGSDFGQLSLLALARRVPVTLPRPELAAMFRGGWSPFRFGVGDTDEIACQLMRYVNNPAMHDVHRSLVRDYVLTFRDSMSMVGEYARLYAQQTVHSATGE